MKFIDTQGEKNGRNRQVVLEEDDDVYSCQRGSRTFAATHCNHHFLSTVRTVVSLWLWWCLRYIRLLSFAEGVIVFFPLSFSLTLIFSLWPPSRNRADTRREWIDFKPLNSFACVDGRAQRRKLQRGAPEYACFTAKYRIWTISI